MSFNRRRVGSSDTERLWSAISHIEDYLARLGQISAPVVSVSSPGIAPDSLIPESQVIFDPADGHAHDGLEGGVRILYSDLRFASLTAGTIWAATSADAASFRIVGCPYGPWTNNDISTAGTSYSAMDVPTKSGGQMTNHLRVPWGGYLIGLSVSTGTTVSGGGSYDVEVYVNGAGSGLTLSIASGSDSGTARHSGIALAMDDRIRLFNKRTGTVSSATGAAGYAWIVMQG